MTPPYSRAARCTCNYFPIYYSAEMFQLINTADNIQKLIASALGYIYLTFNRVCHTDNHRWYCYTGVLNRHQTMLHNFFNFSSIERYHACHIFCKQISSEQKCQICVKCVIWKQIHEKWESVITESWPTFLNGRVRYWAGPSYQPPSATAWPHYITTNWPQVVPQKAHRCEDKQKSFDLPLLLGKASV